MLSLYQSLGTTYPRLLLFSFIVSLVSQLPGKNISPGMQVLIQGNQVAIVAKFLLGKWQETLRGIGTIFGCSDFRDRLGWQVLLMIGRWYLLPPTQWF